MSRAALMYTALLVTLSLATPFESSAQEWPARPLKLIVPFTAGSSSDTIARIVAAKMSERLGQQIVVDNRAGASTIIGTDVVAKSAADGYTIGLANTTTHAASLALTPRLPFDPIHDFTPIGMIGSSPFVLLSSATLPITTLKELVDLAKARPGTLSYASAGTGTLAHLAGELLKYKAGIEVTHIPYRGTAQSTMDLLQGRIDLSISTIPPTLAHIREGKLRALAVLSDSRSEMISHVPTVKEAGFSGCEAELWTALMLPARTPADIVARLRRVLNEVMRSAEVQQALKIQGVDPAPDSARSVSDVIAADIAKWRDVATAAKIHGSN